MKFQSKLQPSTANMEDIASSIINQENIRLHILFMIIINYLRLLVNCRSLIS